MSQVAVAAIVAVSSHFLLLDLSLLDFMTAPSVSSIEVRGGPSQWPRGSSSATHHVEFEKTFL